MKEHHFKLELKYCTQAGKPFRSQRKKPVNGGNKMIYKAKTARDVDPPDELGNSSGACGKKTSLCIFIIN